MSFLISIVVITALATVTGYFWLRSSLPDLAGEIALAGLSTDAEAIYDASGVPHIRAASAEDAYRTLGFVHARDRLFQMDFMRRLGAGHLSEVVGEQTLRIDRTMRTLGLYRQAAATVERLPTDVRRHLDAYAAGVNAYLDARSGALPPEFILLGYEPEPWQAADSLVWGRLMALRLSSNWRTEALRMALSERLTSEQMADLWPRDNGSVPSTLAGTGEPARFARLFGRLLDVMPDELRHVSASNSWAIASDGTASGSPLLANDPHLGFRAPVLWYLVRIEAPGLDVTGATAPGVPFHILGHNGRIAWALTTTESDTQDLFIERLTPGRPGHYDTPDGPQPFVERAEWIAVKDAEPVELKIRETRHGPVISDLGEAFPGLPEGDYVVALAATALAADDMTPLALSRLNRAGDWAAFREALRDFHTPQQNISFADTAGNIGFLAPARVPVRAGGDGGMPAPGWDGSHDWTGFIPFDSLPQALNPPDGRIVNANHRIVPPDYPWHLTYDWAAPYRAARIHDFLDATAPQTPETAAALQTDIRSGAAAAVLPLLLDLAGSPRGRGAAALELLRGWNRDMRRDNPAPLVFTAWLAEVNRGLYADELGPRFGAYYGLRPRVVLHMLEQRQVWCDDVATPETESCGSVVAAALERALAGLGDRFGDDIAAWRWGEAHPALFRHPVFGHLPVLRELADLSIGSDGGAFTVNRAQNRLSDRRSPFASVHGPGYRAIYDLSDLAASRFAIATGQSGNPLSPRYADRLRGWRDGAYLRIPQTRDAALEGALGVLVLKAGR